MITLSFLTERAIDILKYEADPKITNAVADAEHDGTGYWTLNPHVDNMMAFHLNGRTVVVVYLEAEDFEVNDDWAESL